MSELQFPIMQSLDLAASSHILALHQPSSKQDDSLISHSSRLENWLADVDGRSVAYPTTRATSCPPRLAEREQTGGQGQQPLLTFLENMSTATRMGPLHPTYRSVLLGNGVEIDNTGERFRQN